MTSFPTESFSHSFFQSRRDGTAPQQTFQNGELFMIWTLSPTDLNMLFAEDKNVLSYNLDNSDNTRNDEDTPSSGHFAEFSWVQLDNILEQADSRLRLVFSIQSLTMLVTSFLCYK